MVYIEHLKLNAINKQIRNFAHYEMCIVFMHDVAAAVGQPQPGLKPDGEAEPELFNRFDQEGTVYVKIY